MQRILTAIAFIILVVSAYAQPRDFTRHVNPFIGTGGHGHTFPGATMPFGMVQLSPDTRIDNWDGSSGYHYSDNVIYGFSHTHLSGTGIPDGCDILFMPTVGEPQFFAKEGDTSINGYASKFSHANEKAEPGYYSVKLDDDSIVAEMTATPRVGFHRYTYPKSNKANIILDLKWRDKVLDSELNIFEKTTSDDSLYVRGNKETKVTKFTSVTGYRVEGYRRSSFWAKDQIVYFSAEFSKPFENYNIDNDVDEIEIRTDFDYKGKDLKAAFHFKTAANEKILLKVALSFVSIEGARKNLKTELPHWDFDKVRADAKAAWNKELSKIEVSGGTPDQTTNFYTALYHTMIQPNIFNDVDGRYKGHDGKIHNVADATSVSSPHVSKGSTSRTAQRQSTTPSSETAATPPNRGGEQYTVFSLWDTFRAAHPLYTIIDQKRTADFINTFIRIYDQGGRLPVWELWGEETDTMIGYHAVSVIADAMAKGIKGFDYEKAYAAAKHSAELNHFGLAAYKKRGYISMEDETESVSKTLEYAYNDWCIAQMAFALMQEQTLKLAIAYQKDPKGFDPERGVLQNFSEKFDEYAKESGHYSNRSQNYRNLFDKNTGFMRPRQNGGFLSSFSPSEVTFNYTEANAWQYSFFAPHDILGLMNLHGGQKNFASKLDDLFSADSTLSGREQPDITGLIGQYAHGNEPSHHIAYLYNYAGQPWKTQRIVRQIMNHFYKPTPDGLIGNEDCGQMSAWFILSSLGFYQVAPSREFYDVGTPLFREARIHLENGKVFIVKAPNVSDSNIYVKSVKLNGDDYRATLFPHRDMMKGGSLEFEMTTVPNESWFTRFSVSGTGDNLVAVPLIESGGRIFTEQVSVSIRPITSNPKIFYTTDGSEPTEASTAYKAPFTINETSSIKAIAVNTKGETSIPAEARFYKLSNNWTVKIASKYSTQYTGGGDEGLIDGIRGTVNFASGEWQGYQAQNFEAVIDLQKETEIKRVGGSFLQVASSWIWMPERIEFEVSNDGKEFTKIAEIKTDLAVQEMKPTIREFLKDIKPVNARFIRVKAYNFGKIPAWHPGAGGDPWIFVDEIFIR